MTTNSVNEFAASRVRRTLLLLVPGGYNQIARTASRLLWRIPTYYVCILAAFIMLRNCFALGAAAPRAIHRCHIQEYGEHTFMLWGDDEQIDSYFIFFVVQCCSTVGFGTGVAKASRASNATFIFLFFQDQICFWLIFIRRTEKEGAYVDESRNSRISPHYCSVLQSHLSIRRMRRWLVMSANERGKWLFFRKINVLRWRPENARNARISEDWLKNERIRVLTISSMTVMQHTASSSSLCSVHHLIADRLNRYTTNVSVQYLSWHI